MPEPSRRDKVRVSVDYSKMGPVRRGRLRKMKSNEAMAGRSVGYREVDQFVGWLRECCSKRTTSCSQAFGGDKNAGDRSAVRKKVKTGPRSFEKITDIRKLT